MAGDHDQAIERRVDLGGEQPAGWNPCARKPRRFAVDARSRLVSVHQTTYKCAAMTSLARLFREAKPLSG
jgi:hypothetical protein